MPVFGFKDVGFEISTESLGTLRFHRVTPEYAARVDKADFQHDLPPNAFLSLLLVTLGTREDGRPILIEEAYGLSESEREAFVHAFLNEHGEYYRERIVEERLSGRGEKVTRSFLGDRIANPRRPDEDPAGYLTRIYREFTMGVNAPLVRSPDPIPAPLQPTPQLAPINNDRFADSMLKNAALSESLGKSLAQMKALEGKDGAPAEEPTAVAVSETSASAESAAAAPTTTEPEKSVDAAAAEPPATEAAVAPAVPNLPVPDNDTLKINVPAVAAAAQPAEPVDPVRELNESVRRSLEDLTKIAQRNTKLIRSTRRIAILALLLSLVLPLLPLAYLAWYSGYGDNQINKTLLNRSDALSAQQRQQADTIKTLSDELRAMRATPPRRVAD